MARLCGASTRCDVTVAYDPRMHLGWIGSTAAAASATGAFLAFLASVPFSPARFWSWRVRKQMDTVKALDPDRHKAQREVLLRQADVLASRAAAAQRIPTPWKRYVFGVAAWAYFGWGIVAFVVDRVRGVNLRPMDATMGIAVTIVFVWYAIRSTVVYILYDRRERARFIAEGCPADFVRVPTLHERVRAAQNAQHLANARVVAYHRRVRRRAKQMKKAGVMPDDWPRHPRVVRVWRRLLYHVDYYVRYIKNVRYGSG